MKLPGSIGVGLGLGTVALVGVGVVAYLLYKNRDRFNPTSDKNLAYGAVNSAGQALTGDKNFTLGNWLFGSTAAERDINKPVTQAEIEAYRLKKKTEQEVPDPTQPIYVFGA